jgi:tetratricopeptide (TPR) repeat protein
MSILDIKNSVKLFFWIVEDMMKKIFICVLLLIILLNAKPLDSCTIVMVSHGDAVLIGNNEDWTFPFNKIWVVPASEGEYGRICFGFAFDLKGRYTSGGVNDQGLFIDGNGLSGSTGWKPVEEKPTFSGILEDHILAHCATVEDAIRFFQENNVPNLKTGRFPIADKSGASVIVEWGLGKTQFLRGKGAYQISTNFIASNYKPEEYPCYRYKLADKLLGNVKEYSVEVIRNVLAATHYLSSSTVTLFSYICNLKTGDLYVYNFHHFEEVARMNLFDELKKGENEYYIPRLFAYIPFAQWNTVPALISWILERQFNSGGIEKMKKDVAEVRLLSGKTFDHDFSESALNHLGYRLMGANKIKDAIEVFKLNTTEHPQSSNVYDSLAEAYAMDNQIELAIENYRKSVELDPNSKHGKKQIEILRKKRSQKKNNGTKGMEDKK